MQALNKIGSSIASGVESAVNTVKENKWKSIATVAALALAGVAAGFAIVGTGGLIIPVALGAAAVVIALAVGISSLYETHVNRKEEKALDDMNKFANEFFTIETDLSNIEDKSNARLRSQKALPFASKPDFSDSEWGIESKPEVERKDGLMKSIVKMVKGEAPQDKLIRKSERTTSDTRDVLAEQAHLNTKRARANQNHAIKV
jgi:hypothetical protein